MDNQVAAEYSETQQFYLLYNTLQDQKTFMEREIKLLSSIIDTIPDAKTSPLSMKQLSNNATYDQVCNAEDKTSRNYKKI